MIITKMLLLAGLVCFVVDCSGVVDEIEKGLRRILRTRNAFRLGKPWSCSLCLVWWSELILLLVTGNFTFPLVALSGLLSFLSSEISDTLFLIKGLINKLITIIGKII